MGHGRRRYAHRDQALIMADPELIAGEDFYWEDGKMVFTAAYLSKRGYCCESGCRHCPYGFGREGLKGKEGEGKAR